MNQASVLWQKRILFNATTASYIEIKIHTTCPLSCFIRYVFPDAVLVQMLCVHFQVYILPFGGPVSIQWHAGLAEGVWLGAGSQLRQHPNGLGQSRRHIYRTEPTGMALHHSRQLSQLSRVIYIAIFWIV